MGTGAQGLEPPSAAFIGHKQGARLEMAHPEHKQAPNWMPALEVED